MLKGLYSAVSAMIAGITNQAIKVHNSANIDTPGFKQIFTTLQESNKTDVNIPTDSNIGPSYNHIGKLGLGVLTTEFQTNFSNGDLLVTNQSLDLALQGDGFFRILTSEGERFTRDGRFSRDANGFLVTIDGNKIMNSDGVPILLPDGEPVIDSQGGIFINGKKITNLGISEFSNPETQLKNEGGNRFRALEPISQSTEKTMVFQGYLEGSNVNAVDLMIGTKSYQAAQMMVQTQDELLGKSITTLGRTK